MTQIPTSTVRPDDTLGSLATTRAGASRTFARHGLDFCCGGQVSLADACRKKHLDLDRVMREIEAEERCEPDFQRWDQRPIPELIDHIVARFHVPLREELPRLLSMARRVEAVHGQKPSCPRGLAQILAELGAELDAHLQKEEEVLFPVLRSGDAATAAGPIQVLEQEHDDAAAMLRAVRVLTDDHTPPREACGTWRALYLGLSELERDLMQHVHLENHVLFPRALRG